MENITLKYFEINYIIEILNNDTKRKERKEGTLISKNSRAIDQKIKRKEGLSKRGIYSFVKLVDCSIIGHACEMALEDFINDENTVKEY